MEKYPSLTDRIQSSFIDTIFVVILIFVFTDILGRFSDVPDWVRIAMFAGIFIIYEPLMMCFGCTIGNYIQGIRVRKYSDTAKRINIFQAILRYAVKISLGWVSFLTINSNPKKRAIHDIFAGTVMIRK